MDQHGSTGSAGQGDLPLPGHTATSRPLFARAGSGYRARVRVRLLAGIVAVGLLGCDEAASTDGGVADGGAVHDGGRIEPDAGPVELDGGSFEPDAGADAGAPADAATDAGSPAPSEDVCDHTWQASAFANVWDIGPGQTYENIEDAPWQALGPDTLVRIHWRAEPYRAKWVISAEGTAETPIVITGVPDAGRRPVITGQDAVTPTALDYWGEPRSLIKVGGSSTPGGEPGWIYIERLELRGAHPEHRFTDDRGAAGQYADNAASVFVESGHDIFLRNNRVVGSGNGIFSSPPAVNLTLQCNLVDGNGVEGDIYVHNLYLNSQGATLIEYNHFAGLCPTCPGNNLKSRASGLVVRYNWIEDGNRQLDLVDTGEASIAAQPGYDDVFVYGNVLVEGEGEGNSQMVHFGGDSGTTSQYRAGTLHFFHNTVVSTRGGNTTLFRLSFSGASVDARNNVVFATAGGPRLGMLDDEGTARLEHNWLPTGWRDGHSGVSGTLTALANVEGEDPAFVDITGQDFTLGPNSNAIDQGGALATAASAHPVDREYAPHLGGTARALGATPDLGAFEHE